MRDRTMTRQPRAGLGWAMRLNGVTRNVARFGLAILLSGCVEAGIKYYRGAPEETQEELIDLDEIWVKDRETGVDRHLGYVGRYHITLQGGDWEGDEFYRIFNRDLKLVARWDRSGRLHRFEKGDYVLVGSHYTLYAALFDVFGFPPDANIFFSERTVNPYRDSPRAQRVPLR